ncbi:TlpA family protein disulfide reductase [Pedobacter alluvionis]|nr:TlpA disulfide reductase family protein [Pedobacter alluvionis]RLJ77369.1 thioredoxin-like protein [Pedobacter alluvionis]
MNSILKSTILIFILINISQVKAQKHSVTITGTLDTGLIKRYASNEIYIRINETTNLQSQGAVFKAPILRTANFSLKLELPDSSAYISFELIDKLNDDRFVTINSSGNRALREVYLIEVGDSIDIKIDKSGIFNFSGKGSSKLNCQWQYYNIDLNQKGIIYRESELDNLGEYSTKLNVRHKVVDLATKIRREILNSYKDMFSNKIYELFNLDILSLGEYEKRSFLWRMSVKSTIERSEQGKKAAIEYYNSSLKNDPFAKVAPKYSLKSAYFAEMLFQRELTFFQLYNKKGSSYRGDSFSEIYFKLKNSYNGSLRDKLIYICFERLHRDYFEESLSLIDDALLTMNDKKYSHLLQELVYKQYRSFAFELPDTNGRIHTLSEYNGKVIVLDFWYTGCSWCMSLNKAMEPVINKYRSNKNVVFITVCVDKDKDKWMKSIISGKYTSLNSVNLYTAGLGLSHPLIKNYNITAFPRQLIIGKKGQLISTSPPRVDLTPNGRSISKGVNLTSEANEKQFIKLIDKSLD